MDDVSITLDAQLWGACYHRLLVAGLPITAEFAENLLDNLLSGIQAPTSPAEPGR